MVRKDEFDDSRSGVVASIWGVMSRKNSAQSRNPVFSILPILCLGAVFAAVLYYSYPAEKNKQELNAAPVIRASVKDYASYKVTPDDPGGMDIPYRDSTIFESLRAARAAESEGRVESLLSDNEEPMSREELFAGLRTENIEIEEELTEEPKQEQEIFAVTDEVREKVIEKIIAAIPQPSSKPYYKAHEAASIKPAAGDSKRVVDEIAAKDKFFVQLGSLRSHEAAEKSWGDLQKTFPSQLQTVDLRVQRVDLGSKGIYFRVQGGPLEQNKAQSICTAIKVHRPGGCLVTKP